MTMIRLLISTIWSNLISLLIIQKTDIVAELNINRSYDDLLDVSTTYLGPDLVQSNHVFNPEPTFPIAYDCQTDGELLGGGKLDILLDTGASKSYMSKAFYLNNPPPA